MDLWNIPLPYQARLYSAVYDFDSKFCLYRYS